MIRLIASAALVWTVLPGAAIAQKGNVGSAEDLNQLLNVCARGWDYNQFSRAQSCETVLARYHPRVNKKFSMNTKGLMLAYLGHADATSRLLLTGEAMASVGEALKVAPNEPLVIGMRGVVRARNDEFSDALLDLDFAISKPRDQSIGDLTTDAFFKVVRLAALVGLKRHGEAARGAEAVLKAEPANVPARKLLAEVQKELKQYEDAVQTYKVLSALQPQVYEWDSAISTIYRMSAAKNDALALAHITKAIERKPDAASLYSDRSMVYRGSTDPAVKDLSKAIDDYRVYIALTRDPADYIFQDFALLLHQAGRSEEGLKLVEEKLKKWPEADGLYARKGAILKDLKKFDESLTAYKAALAILEKKKDELFTLRQTKGEMAEVYLAKGDKRAWVETAIDGFDPEYADSDGFLLKMKLTPKSDDNQEQLKEKAELLKFAQEKLPPAFHKLKEKFAELENSARTANDPAVIEAKKEREREGAYLAQARKKATAGDQPGQLEALDTAIKEIKKPVQSLQSRAQLYLAMGDMAKARADFDRAVELDPDSLPLRLERSTFYEKVKEYDKGVADADVMVRLQPDDADGHNVRAWLLYLMKKYDAARPSAEKAVELTKQQSGNALDTLAHIHQASGKIEEAIAAYRLVFKAPDAADTVRAYQKGLTQKGLYKGTQDGVASPDLEAILVTCVRTPGCDPLGPDY